MDKMLFTVEEAAGLLGIGRSRMFDLIRTGELRSVKIGVSRRITFDALREYVAALEKSAAA